MQLQLTILAILLTGLSGCDRPVKDRSLQKISDLGEIDESSLVGDTSSSQAGGTPASTPGSIVEGDVAGGIIPIADVSGKRKCSIGPDGKGRCESGCEFKYARQCYYDSTASTNNPDDPSETTLCEGCEHKWIELVTLEKDIQGNIPKTPFAPTFCPDYLDRWPLNNTIQPSIVATSSSNTNFDSSTWGGVNATWEHGLDIQCSIQGSGRYQLGGGSWSFDPSSRMCKIYEPVSN